MNSRQTLINVVKVIPETDGFWGLSMIDER